MADNPLYQIQSENTELVIQGPLFNPITGKPWGFTCEKCVIWIKGWQDFYEPTDFNEEDTLYPKRCKRCDKMKNQYGRMMDQKKRIMERYDKTIHPYVGFLTLNLPGGNYQGLRKMDPSAAEQKIKDARKELYRLFTKWWRNYGKKNFPGAIRFFEWTEAPSLTQEHLEDDMPGTEVERKIHPHLHVMVLQSEKKCIKEIRQSILNAGFGDQIDMKWRKDCSTFRSIDYCLSYVKKDLQCDGRNRQSYGCLYGTQSNVDL